MSSRSLNSIIILIMKWHASPQMKANPNDPNQGKDLIKARMS